MAEEADALVEGAAWLEIMASPKDRFPIETRLVVGRDRSCGASIPEDGRLEPIHCSIERTRSGFVLQDAGTATGTIVNGRKVSEIELQGGETIMVGRSLLRFGWAP